MANQIITATLLNSQDTTAGTFLDLDHVNHLGRVTVGTPPALHVLDAVPTAATTAALRRLSMETTPRHVLPRRVTPPTPDINPRVSVGDRVLPPGKLLESLGDVHALGDGPPTTERTGQRGDIDGPPGLVQTVPFPDAPLAETPATPVPPPAR